MAGSDRGHFRGLGRDHIVDTSELVPVDTHLAAVLEGIGPLEPLEIRFDDSLGLVLADDLRSSENLPSFRNSSMDGYAVIADDVSDARQGHPAQLRVAGEVAAGGPVPRRLTSGQALRIMTGAPMPEGANAVVPVEVTSDASGHIEVHRPSAVGEFVRDVGEDVAVGDLLLERGHRVRPGDIGLMAAVGANRVFCHPSPRVVILSTGDELVDAEREPGPGRIRNANGPMLGALVRQLGGIPYQAGIIADDRKALMYAFDSNLGHADLFLTTGGVSAGAYDHVKDVIGRLGDVWAAKVAMQPGMPQVHGRIDDVPVLGLPGNPVSTFVSFEVFARPLIRRLQGRADSARPVVTAVLGGDITSPPAKRSFLRVALTRAAQGWVATPTGHQGSHVLTSVVRADGLAEIPEEATAMAAGEQVNVRLLVEA